MVFSVEYLIWYISQFMVLEPGDIINTGTPPVFPRVTIKSTFSCPGT